MLTDAITRYVEFNQAVGMRFHVDAAILKAFHRHVGEADVAAISPDVVLAFLQPRHRVTSRWLMKHRAVRRFYQYAITRGLTETFVPHIYSDEELRRLLAGLTQNQARVRCTITAPTFRAFLLLLYGTGLRLGEALALRREDVDLHAGMILIRETKFYKSRHLPIGPTLTRSLAEYVEAVPVGRGPIPTAFFVNRRGDRMPHRTAWHNFASLREQVGVQGRLHDLRHHLCRASVAGVVPRRGQRPAVLAAPVDLPRPRTDCLHPALSHDDPGAPGTGQPAIRDLCPIGGPS